MGLTISSKNYSIDLGYFGFNNLRTKIAKLTGKEIAEHYSYLQKGIFITDENEKKEFFDRYNKRIMELENNYKIPVGILEFLYASDCNGKLSFTKCKQIYKVIENYDDDVLYGYSGRKDCAKFKDFKKIVKDCIDNKVYMQWR